MGGDDASMLLDQQEKELDAFFAAAAAVRSAGQQEHGHLDQVEAKVRAFAKDQVGKGRSVVFVTSGGTTVPLEHNTVRFIDNFSTGKRGAAIAERFLEKDYAVVFLGREGSAMPFACRIQAATGSSTGFGLDLLQHLEYDNETDAVRFTASRQVSNAVNAYHSSKDRLLHIPFTSLSDYLHQLKACALGLKTIETKAIFVLAAAVSDFHVPPQDMAQHKIQSRDGPLALELAQVPKALGVLRHRWAPNAFFVSFKLETDVDILIQKAQKAIENYDMNVVVANELKTRYQKIILVSREEQKAIEKGDHEELEVPLIGELAKLHDGFMGLRTNKKQKTN